MAKKIYIKYVERTMDVIMEKQAVGNVISETECGWVTAEFEMNGKKEIKSLQEGQYSETPYLMRF